VSIVIKEFLSMRFLVLRQQKSIVLLPSVPIRL